MPGTSPCPPLMACRRAARHQGRYGAAASAEWMRAAVDNPGLQGLPCKGVGHRGHVVVLCARGVDTLRTAKLLQTPSCAPENLSACPQDGHGRPILWDGVLLHRREIMGRHCDESCAYRGAIGAGGALVGVLTHDLQGSRSMVAVGADRPRRRIPIRRDRSLLEAEQGWIGPVPVEGARVFRAGRGLIAENTPWRRRDSASISGWFADGASPPGLSSRTTLRLRRVYHRPDGRLNVLRAVGGTHEEAQARPVFGDRWI